MARGPIMRFWMVQGDGPATVRHASREAAEAEAERLARAHPGVTFFVVEAVAAYRKADVERISLRPHYEDEDDGELPF